jgi:hypothetical protein
MSVILKQQTKISATQRYKSKKAGTYKRAVGMKR